MKPKNLYPDVKYGNKEMMARWDKIKDKHCVVASWYRGHRGYLIVQTKKDKYYAMYVSSKKKGIHPLDLRVAILFFKSKEESKYKSQARFNNLLQLKVLEAI